MFFQELLEPTVKWGGCLVQRTSSFPPTQGCRVLTGRMRLTFLLFGSLRRNAACVPYDHYNISHLEVKMVREMVAGTLSSEDSDAKYQVRAESLTFYLHSQKTPQGLKTRITSPFYCSIYNKIQSQKILFLSLDFLSQFAVSWEAYYDKRDLENG